MALLIVLAIVVGAAPLVWAKPVRGIYILFAAAVTIEIFPLGFSDSLTDQLPFFLNLNNSGIAGLSITPAEILMVIALISWWANYAANRHENLRPQGRILTAYVVYLVVVLFAEVRGLLSGANLNISLWELRPQVYGFILFLLTASLIRERRQLLTLAGIFLAGTGLKAVLGFNRYVFTLNHDLGSNDSILGHEASYFLLLFLVAVVCILIWYRRRSLGIRFERTVQVRLAIISAVAAVFLVIFFGANWNKQDGLVGQVVRPVHSMFQPDDRDFSSNLYRQNENANLTYSFNQNRLFGVGFGSPMPIIFPLADISQSYPLWQYIPHNTLLWIGMRMGLIGFAAFFALVGMTILEGVRQVATRDDALLRGIAVFALAAVIAELMVAYGDVQLENYRNMIFTGTLIGLIDAIPQIAHAPVAAVAWTRTELLRQHRLAPDAVV